MVLLVLEVPPQDSNLGSQEDGDSQLENIMSYLEGQGACFSCSVSLTLQKLYSMQEW